jgi:hypothetical protein
VLIVLAFALLVAGALLAVASPPLPGLDLLIALCPGASRALGAASALRGGSRLGASGLGLLSCGLAALALGLHLCLNLGLLV